MPKKQGPGGAPQDWSTRIVPKDYPVSKDIEDKRNQGWLGTAWDAYIGGARRMAKDIGDTWDSVTRKD